MRTGWYRIAAVVAMVIVAINAWIALHAVRVLFLTQNARSHTYEVLYHAMGIEDAASKATAVVRAYILTGDPTWEERYRGFYKDLDNEIDQVRRLTGDNPDQQRRIEYLISRAAVRTSALEIAMQMRKDEGEVPDKREVARVLADYPDGGPTIGYCVQQIENEENRLLRLRTEEAVRAHQSVLWTFSIASALALLFIGLTADLLIRTARTAEALAASEAEVRHLNEDLREANVSLEDRVEKRTRELEIINQELETFSYSVSHDLRAPLRTIDGFSLALEEDYAENLDETAKDYIHRVRTGVQRMGQLIDALLQLSRVTRADLAVERFDMTAMGRSVMADLQALEPERKIEMIVQPGMVAVGDPKLVRIALENLIGNAWKFTSKTEHAVIELSSTTVDRHTLYTVKDNGAGFDMQYRDRLFTAFQRLHGDRDFKGSGIGLATVSRIIRRHHGMITAEGEPGNGAAFSFTLSA